MPNYQLQYLANQDLSSIAIETVDGSIYDAIEPDTIPPSAVDYKGKVLTSAITMQVVPLKTGNTRSRYVVYNVHGSMFPHQL